MRSRPGAHGFGLGLSTTEPETELKMSATAALEGHVRYKKQLKLMRARIAANWTTDVIARAIDAFRAEPSPAEWIDEVTPNRPGYYGVFY